jgi:hypothetical protein
VGDFAIGLGEKRAVVRALTKQRVGLRHIPFQSRREQTKPTRQSMKKSTQSKNPEKKKQENGGEDSLLGRTQTRNSVERQLRHQCSPLLLVVAFAIEAEMLLMKSAVFCSPMLPHFPFFFDVRFLFLLTFFFFFSP